MMHADSSQLEKYGLKVGLKNYAAGYCVGLLLARRVLDKVGLADAFEGQKEPDGEEFHVEGEYDADFHKQRIFGGHVAEHMESLKEEDEQEYEKVYSKYIEESADCDDLEELYQGVHEKIREDPVHEKKKSTEGKPTRNGNEVSNG